VKNITVSVPDEVYRRARVWAAERETSVSATVTHFLEALPEMERAIRHLSASQQLSPAQPPATPARKLTN
jgi:hypothetical protein